MFRVARLSLIRCVRDTIQTLPRQTDIPIEYIDWDAHADMQQLPNADLIGINGFGMTENEGLEDVVFGITVSTYQDPNLFRMVDMADALYERLKGGKQWDVYAEDGTVSGVATMVKGTTVMPVTRSEMRNLFTITGSALMLPKLADS